MPVSKLPFESLNSRLKAGEKLRILAFGSSNTEHFLAGMHWVEVLDLALCWRYGRLHHTINAGIGGNTSRDLLERFESDAAFYRPALAIITIGGNDSNPERNIPPAAFEANLLELRERFAALGSQVAFQTYYSPDPARNGDLSVFHSYMDIVRKVAAETDSGLVDHLRRWEAFRKAFPERYLPLMQDGFHLNWRGNVLLGLDLARAAGCPIRPAEPGFWEEALELQRLMDQAAGGEA